MTLTGILISWCPTLAAAMLALWLPSPLPDPAALRVYRWTFDAAAIIEWLQHNLIIAALLCGVAPVNRNCATNVVSVSGLCSGVVASSYQNPVQHRFGHTQATNAMLNMLILYLPYFQPVVLWAAGV